MSDFIMRPTELILAISHWILSEDWYQIHCDKYFFILSSLDLSGIILGVNIRRITNALPVGDKILKLFNFIRSGVFEKVWGGGGGASMSIVFPCFETCFVE